MTWREAVALTDELANDPSSHVAAALQEWEHTWTREAFILADLFDLVRSAISKKHPIPYPRPTEKGEVRSKPLVSQEVIRKALAARGH